MLTDVAIAQSAKLRPITDVARELGIADQELELYGHYKAKISLAALNRLQNAPSGKLIYTTAITATPAGEGKTTIAVGLTQGLGRLGKRVAVALREPSLGPVFGIKGGATGGGYSQVVPMEDINLHFTGDIHAVGATHNLLAAIIDNHIYQGNSLGIDPRRVLWRRVMDINDRQLRNIVVGLGGKSNGIPRESGFDITAASEIMAILCLANGPEDLKARLGRILIGFTYEGKPVYAGDLRVTGALAALLCDALKPNLVQTIEGQPAFVHGGPFANIAHGNNSILATRLALKTADYTVTEGGFAADLGAEKFFDIVHGYSGLRPDVAVLVASVRALHMHGGVGRADVAHKNLAALEEGLANLKHHVNNMAKYGLPVVVAINRFPSDDAEELAFIDKYCQQLGVASAVCDVVANGGAGGIKLAEVVLDVLANQPSRFQPLYNWKHPIKDKLAILARDIYGANGVTYTANAERDIALCNELGLSELPVCVAKTQHSISDNPALKGVPTNYEITVREVRPAPGAGFLVCLTGDVMTMPGLPKAPAAERIDLTAEGVITGLS